MPLVLLSAVALLACSRPPPIPVLPPADPGLPNVVLVSVDTLRQDSLQSYGGARPVAPYLDALAARGVRFADSVAQAPNTVPSHASMLTGRWPQEHQSFSSGRLLEDSETTLAEVLAAQHYDTFAAVSSYRFVQDQGFSQGFLTYLPFWSREKNDRSRGVTEAILARAAAQTDSPIFAFLHYFDPHAPYAAPEGYRDRWVAPRTDLRPEATVAFLSAHRHRPVSPEQLLHLRGLYDGGVTYLDDQLADLGQRLRFANGRSTLWIFTADHGDAFKEHGYLGHSIWMYDEILRVPLLMVWEGHLPAGQVVLHPAQSADILPTVLDLIGLGDQVPAGVRGRSLAAPARDPAALPPQGYTHPDATDIIPTMQDFNSWAVTATLRNGGRYRLVKHRRSAHQLFRLDQDPEARADLVGSSQPEAAVLLAIAQEIGIVDGAAPRSSGARQTSTEEQEMLRSLGYIDEADE